jgi:hypothetical protein
VVSSDATPSLRRIGEGRFKRSLLGYRPREVDTAITRRDAALHDAGARLADAERLIGELELELKARGAELARGRQRIAELERIATRLAERVVERERELREVREEIAALRAQGDERMRALAVLAEDLQMVRGQARAQANRMRLRALRDAAELARGMGDLADDPDGADGRLIDSLRDAIERISAAEDADETVDLLAASNGRPPPRPDEMFDGLVEVEVGPLSDFSQLVGFEDAAAGIGASSEISVRRFTKGRATLAMRFKQPVELLRELEDRAPFVFKVRDLRSDRIVLDVDE